MREGKDVTIATFSICVGKALKAAEVLAKEGIEVEVIDLRTLRPLDTETIIESVKKTNRLITAEEGFPFASVGSEIASIVIQEAFDYLDAPIIKIAGKDVPMPYAVNLEKLVLPQADDIADACREICGK